MASLAQWAWVSVNSRSWWWKGRPGMLPSIGSQRVGYEWVTELNWTERRGKVEGGQPHVWGGSANRETKTLSWTTWISDFLEPPGRPWWLILNWYKTRCMFLMTYVPDVPGAALLLYFHWLLRKKVKSFSHVRLFAAPWTVANQAPLSMGFSRQEYWSGLSFPPPRKAAKTILFLTRGFLSICCEQTEWNISLCLSPFLLSNLINP